MSDEKEVDLTGTDRPALSQVTSEGSIPAVTEGAAPIFTTGGSRSASEDNVAKPKVIGRRIRYHTLLEAQHRDQELNRFFGSVTTSFEKDFILIQMRTMFE